MATLKLKSTKAEVPSPTEQLTAQANQAYVVTDTTGRRITLQKPGLLAQFRIVKMVGGETAANRVYMNMILPVTFVVAIDDLPVPPPTNQAQLDALIQRLDEHGLSACMEGLKKHWGADDEDESPKETLETVKA